jgi:nicotinate-nucleotide pyrophosphorylase (carboxylating)
MPESHDPIAIALAEDIGTGDLTSMYFVDEGNRNARIFAKEPAVAAGVETAAEVFRRVDPKLCVEIVQPSGAILTPGDTVLTITGATRSILTSERVALNFLQRLSGVATLTRRYVDAVGPHRTRILDNHRFGLYDMVMVKDNHLAAGNRLPALQSAIRRFRTENPGKRVEVEADTLEQVRGFLTLEGIDVILLDNMNCADMKAAVDLGGGRVPFEASGGITLESIPKIAATGVDFISAGALTHSARAIDFSLELES